MSLAALIPKMEVLDTSTISAETSAVNTSPRTPSPPSSPEHADSDDEQVGYVEVVAEPSAGDALPVTVSSTSLEVHSPLKPADSAAGSAEAVPVDPQTPTTQPEPAAQPEPTVAPADDVQPAPATTDGDESTGPASATVSQDQLPVFEALWQIAVPAGKGALSVGAAWLHLPHRGQKGRNRPSCLSPPSLPVSSLLSPPAPLPPLPPSREALASTMS